MNDPVNRTLVDNFILMSFSEYPNIEITLFFIFLFIYFVCLVGNMLLLLIISLSTCLHTPMYFFLFNLAFLDICFTSLILPKFLLTSLNMRSISFLNCMMQLYLYIGFQSTEYLLLTVMSYDRYVAICKPLHYSLILNKKVYILLATFTWFVGFVDPALPIRMISHLPFTKSRQINHFFCDLMPLLQLSFGDITKLEVVILVEGAFLGFPSFILTLSSYISIILVIMKIQTARGRYKAFSTCSSHLTVVMLLYMILFCLYFRPPSENFQQNTKAVSLLNVIVIPMLNPLIYSLRNRDVKQALHKFLKIHIAQTYDL